MYKTKIFFGAINNPHTTTADSKFNDWIRHHTNIEIVEFKYQQARLGDHSICILYKEN